MNFCKTKMADKKSQKPSSSRNPNPVKKPLTFVKNEPPFCPGLVTPSQLVTYDPHQVTPVNSPAKPSTSRMTSLGKPIQQGLSFARALSNDYDHFAKKKAPPAPTKYVKSSPYFPIYSYKLLHVEFHHRNITNPLTLIIQQIRLMVPNYTLHLLIQKKPWNFTKTSFNRKDLLKLPPFMINFLMVEFSITNLILLNLPLQNHGIPTRFC